VGFKSRPEQGAAVKDFVMAGGKSENLDGLEYENHRRKSVAGWACPYGKGRMFSLPWDTRITPCVSASAKIPIVPVEKLPTRDKG
jgi:hypothetical protein